MDIQEITKLALNNIVVIVGVLGVIAVILLALLINLYMKVSYMKKRYRKMMTGADGANLERMLIVSASCASAPLTIWAVT